MGGSRPFEMEKKRSSTDDFPETSRMAVGLCQGVCTGRGAPQNKIYQQYLPSCLCIMPLQGMVSSWSQ